MRRCPVVDPDNHHLFVSLGCAAENFVHGASAHGFAAEGRFDASGDGGYSLALTPTGVTRSPLFQAIFDRQCTRGDYDGRMLSSSDLRLLSRVERFRAYDSALGALYRDVAEIYRAQRRKSE
jgi:hypothetical protein